MHLDVPLAVIKSTGKRSGRAAPASSPLLRHAGLGPDIRRAFAVDSSDALPEEPSREASPQTTVCYLPFAHCWINWQFPAFLFLFIIECLSVFIMNFLWIIYHACNFGRQFDSSRYLLFLTVIFAAFCYRMFDYSSIIGAVIAIYGAIARDLTLLVVNHCWVLDWWVKCAAALHHWFLLITNSTSFPVTIIQLNILHCKFLIKLNLFCV